jgi:hypothetical protein
VLSTRTAVLLALSAVLAAGGAARADDRETNEKLKKELAAAEKRNAELARELDETRKRLTQAQRAEKIARDATQARLRKLEERIEKLALGGRLGAGGPPVLANPRGEVTEVAGDLVTLSIGIDAGLAVGSVLDVYRTDPEARYLGTVKVTDVFNLYPKQALLKFTPARDVPLKDLKPEELPKKGDLVRPVLADLRGEVTGVAGNVVTLGVGIDGGLEVGTLFDLYRADGKTHLGTLVVTRVTPKSATATFVPSRKVALKNLKPDELPMKGDVVRPLKTKD